MPIAAPRPCSYPCCRSLAMQAGRCEAHQREAWTKRPKATKRITGRRLQAMRADLFRRVPLCEECERHGRVTLATERDHKVPLCDGGTDDSTNEQALCHDCHEAKSLGESLRARRGARSSVKVPIF